jgi:hypothetical protein
MVGCLTQCRAPLTPEHWWQVQSLMGSLFSSVAKKRTDSRDKLMQWVEDALALNLVSRSQRRSSQSHTLDRTQPRRRMRFSREEVCTEAFAVNLCAVLVRTCAGPVTSRDPASIKFDVRCCFASPRYTHSALPSSRVLILCVSFSKRLRVDEARLHATRPEAETAMKQACALRVHSSPALQRNSEPKSQEMEAAGSTPIPFSTELLFYTLDAIHLGFMPAMRFYFEVGSGVHRRQAAMEALQRQGRTRLVGSTCVLSGARSDMQAIASSNTTP